ncbi:hypothetical protein JOF36_000539 [Pseudonocardia parietis]|uniref:Basic proline-rich protein n=1 Tax=Pseudonocardia parietis TaxID=570936 RepID=A0ABS4VLP5_9PSEU|nr:hypothetical protein [Pseudonocardia parietis]
MKHDATPAGTATSDAHAVHRTFGPCTCRATRRRRPAARTSPAARPTPETGPVHVGTTASSTDPWGGISNGSCPVEAPAERADVPRNAIAGAATPRRYDGDPPRIPASPTRHETHPRRSAAFRGTYAPHPDPHRTPRRSHPYARPTRVPRNALRSRAGWRSAKRTQDPGPVRVPRNAHRRLPTRVPQGPTILDPHSGVRAPRRPDDRVPRNAHRASTDPPHRDDLPRLLTDLRSAERAPEPPGDVRRLCTRPPVHRRDPPNAHRSSDDPPPTRRTCNLDSPSPPATHRTRIRASDQLRARRPSGLQRRDRLSDHRPTDGGVALLRRRNHGPVVGTAMSRPTPPVARPTRGAVGPRQRGPTQGGPTQGGPTRDRDMGDRQLCPDVRVTDDLAAGSNVASRWRR